MSEINALIAKGSTFGNAFGDFADSYEEQQKIRQAQAYRNALLQQQQTQDAALAARHNDQMALDRDQLAETHRFHDQSLGFEGRRVADEEARLAAPKAARTGMATVNGRTQLVNLDTGELIKDLGQAGQRNQALPTDAAARIGLAKRFFKRLPGIEATMDELFGPKAGLAINQRSEMALNMGKPAEMVRAIQSGREALIRTLTGQGMSVREAENQASRYEPSATDKYDTMRSKLKGLAEDLQATTEGMTQGRGVDTTTPGSDPAAAPPQSGGLPYPTDDPRLSQELWNSWPIEVQQAWLSAPQ